MPTITVERISGSNCKVDLPVYLTIWCRPKLQKAQFNLLREAAPSKLFLISDGGRTLDEKNKIKESRAIFDKIDWDCEVHRIFWDENQGLYKSAEFGADYLWNHADRALFLEDDIQFSRGSLAFCSDLLKRYEDDERIQGICLMNQIGCNQRVAADYFFSKVFTVWGFALWKRSFLKDTESLRAYSNYEIQCIEKEAVADPDICKRIRAYRKDDIFEGHAPWMEFFQGLSVFSNNRLFIVPKFNMINNKGCTDDAAHGASLKMLPKGMREPYEITSYPFNKDKIVHPSCIVQDRDYQKAVYRQMAVGYPLIRLYRKINRSLRIFVYKGPISFCKEIGYRLHRKRNQTEN